MEKHWSHSMHSTQSKRQPDQRRRCCPRQVDLLDFEQAELGCLRSEQYGIRIAQSSVFDRRSRTICGCDAAPKKEKTTLGTNTTNT
jgi:hypothetical protein